MAFRYKIFWHKNLFGFVYIFDKRGDGIGMHNHDEDNIHNMIVLKGSFSVYGPNKEWEFFLKQGEYMELLPEHHPHEVMALEDNSEVLTLLVSGVCPEIGPGFPKEGIITNKPITIPLE